GATVAVGTVLAEIDASARPGEAHPAEHNGKQAESGEQQIEPDGERSGPGAAAPDGGDRSRFYSPVVRRIAEKHGVDLDQVRGTGIGGRVRKKDLMAYIKEEGGPAPPEPVLHIESPYQPEAETPAVEAPETEAAPAPAAGPPSSGIADELVGPTRREPMSAMRQAIARHMLESRRTAAHCTTIIE